MGAFRDFRLTKQNIENVVFDILGRALYAEAHAEVLEEIFIENASEKKVLTKSEITALVLTRYRENEAAFAQKFL